MADVLMPKLGESVTEGTLGQWLKRVGDAVQKYEPLVEVVTDKLTAEIPSDVDGVLSEILVGQNQTFAVGTLIARITTDQESAVQVPPQVTEVASEAAGVAAPAVFRHEDTRTVTGSAGKRYSPAVRKLAATHQIDPSSVQGTGLGGRVTRKDVLRAVANPIQAPQADQVIHNAPAKTDPVSFHDAVSETKVAITPIRRTIARRMTESARDIPHAWMMVEVDVTKMVRLREKHKRVFKEREGIDLTFFPFFMKAAIEALKAYPMVNSTWTDDNIIMHKDVNLSIAVATEDALVVPVIHQADRMSISGLAFAVSDLASRARLGKLTLDDVQGGTFTLNNTGAFGSIQSKPIIDAPRAAIVSVESIVKRPVVVDGDGIAIRSMVNLCISIDHRVLDGLITGRFMRHIKERLESMDESTSLY